MGDLVEESSHTHLLEDIPEAVIHEQLSLQVIKQHNVLLDMFGVLWGVFRFGILVFGGFVVGVGEVLLDQVGSETGVAGSTEK